MVADGQPQSGHSWVQRSAAGAGAYDQRSLLAISASAKKKLPILLRLKSGCSQLWLAERGS